MSNEACLYRLTQLRKTIDALNKETDAIREKRLEAFMSAFSPYFEAVEEISDEMVMPELFEPLDFCNWKWIYDVDSKIHSTPYKDGKIVDYMIAHHPEGEMQVPLSILEIPIEEYRARLHQRKCNKVLFYAQERAARALKEIETLKMKLEQAKKAYDESWEEVATIYKKEIFNEQHNFPN